MRLVKCKKCGATVMTGDTLLSNMQDEYNELIKKSHRAKGAEKQIISVQLSHLSKMMRAVIHTSTEVEVKKLSAYSELGLLKSYIRACSLMTDKELDDIQSRARAMSREKIAQDEKELNRIYGEFRNICNNNTKRDPTADEAVRNVLRRE